LTQCDLFLLNSQHALNLCCYAVKRIAPKLGRFVFSNAK
jgi:hypothetical protein